LPKTARNSEINPLAKANAPRNRTIRREKNSGELSARSPTRRERTAPVISQPLLFVFIVEVS
jgi:hypothetical protein